MAVALIKVWVKEILNPVSLNPSHDDRTCEPWDFEVILIIRYRFLSIMMKAKGRFGIS